MTTRDAPSLDRVFTIGEGGQRNFLHPAATKGPNTTRRAIVGYVLIALLVALPFIDIGGYPAIWLDVTGRRFHLFGVTFGPTDSYLLFFLLTGTGFSLIVASALWGRVWCGYACPQTVFLEQLYRRVERAFEGSREAQLKLEKAPWSPNKLLRKGGKTVAFFALSFLLAHLFLCYFVSPAELARLMRAGPSSEPGVFIWATALTGVMYFNFAWFREQLCIIICPYGRLQSALSDRDTVVVGYDARRGEPRGKKQQTDGGKTGDCVDCFRCVAVCPTGIDIRQGMQLECVGCMACMDACDDVMVKIGRSPGLIRRDSQRGLDGEKRRTLQPRVVFYSVLALAGLVAFGLTLNLRRPLAVQLSRQPGMPYVLDGNTAKNTFVLRAHNLSDNAKTLSVVLQGPVGLSVIGIEQPIVLAPGEHLQRPLFFAAPKSLGPFDFALEATDDTGTKTTLKARFTAPDKSP